MGTKDRVECVAVGNARVIGLAGRRTMQRRGRVTGIHDYCAVDLPPGEGEQKEYASHANAAVPSPPSPWFRSHLHLGNHAALTASADNKLLSKQLRSRPKSMHDARGSSTQHPPSRKLNQSVGHAQLKCFETVGRRHQLKG
jgi:hypothetical protein